MRLIWINTTNRAHLANDRRDFVTPGHEFRLTCNRPKYGAAYYGACHIHQGKRRAAPRGQMSLQEARAWIAQEAAKAAGGPVVQERMGISEDGCFTTYEPIAA